MQVQKVIAALDQIEAAIASGKLTDTMIHNAMVNLDRATPCFGRSAFEWRKVAAVVNNVQECAPYTLQDLREFVADKREMFAQNPHMLNRN